MAELRGELIFKYVYDDDKLIGEKKYNTFINTWYDDEWRYDGRSGWDNFSNSDWVDPLLEFKNFFPGLNVYEYYVVWDIYDDKGDLITTEKYVDNYFSELPDPATYDGFGGNYTFTFNAKVWRADIHEIEELIIPPGALSCNNSAPAGIKRIIFETPKDDFEYTISISSSVVSSTCEEIICPDNIEVSIGAHAFQHSQIKRVEAKYLKSIGDYAFGSCGDLEEIVYATGGDSRLTYIGKYAFYEAGQTGFNMYLPSDVTIGEGAFSFSNFSSDTIHISENMSLCSGWKGTFYGTNIRKVILENDVPKGCFQHAKVREIEVLKPVNLGDFAFEGCNLTGELFANFINIGTACFKGNNIETLILGEYVEVIGMAAFNENNITGHLVFPDSVKKIGTNINTSSGGGYTSYGGVFEKNPIQSIEFGENIEDIEVQAFMYCYSLTGTINLKADRVSYDAFRNTNIKKAIFNVRELGGGFNGNGSLKAVEIIGGESIASSAFFCSWGSVSLTYAYIAPSINSIGSNAFSGTKAIFGVPGSEAERYANSENIPFNPTIYRYLDHSEEIIREDIVREGEEKPKSPIPPLTIEIDGKQKVFLGWKEVEV